MRNATKAKRNQLFTKGPIPLAWQVAAAKLPGKVLQTGLAIWFLAGIRESNTVILGNELLAHHGVSRRAKVRCLKALEGAGLIFVEYRENKNPRITLLRNAEKLDTLYGDDDAEEEEAVPS